MEQSIKIPQIIMDYIDVLTDVERDRIIEATNFKVGGGYKSGERIKKVRAVMGEDLRPREVETKKIQGESEGCLIDHAKAGTSQTGYHTVGVAFDSFYKKHGEKAIEAIKEYAGRRNSPPAEVPTETPQELGHVLDQIKKAEVFL